MIGITLVLLAVFVPASFLGGITGQLYRQFALTIAATALISALNAVTLKPAQCAVYLRPSPERRNAFFRAFNAVYDRCEGLYASIIRRAVRHCLAMMILFVGLAALTAWWFTRLPTGFFPQEDQGYAIVGVQLPDAASQVRTRAVVSKVDKVLKQTPGVSGWFMIGGSSVLDGAVASNAASYYLTFTPWEERTGRPGLSQDEILKNLTRQFDEIREATIFAFAPPAVEGLGVSGGFQMQLEDRAAAGREELQKAADELIEDGNKQTSAAEPEVIISRRRTDDLRRCGSRESQEPGRAPGHLIRHVAGFTRIGLC